MAIFRRHFPGIIRTNRYQCGHYESNMMIGVTCISVEQNMGWDKLKASLNSCVQRYSLDDSN